MRKFFKNTLLILFVVSVCFNFNVRPAHSLASAIWRVFDRFMGDKANEAYKLFSKASQRDASIDFVELLKEGAMAGIFDDSGDSVLKSHVQDDGSFFNDSLHNIDPSLLADLNALINSTAENLREMGFFDFSEDTMGLTEEELRSILFSMYLRDIIAPVIDLGSGQLVGTVEEIEFIIDPQFPRPGQSISVKIQALGIDLNTARITWWNAGAVVHSGVGASVLNNFVLRNDGLPENFRVVIQKSDSGVIEKSFQIHPADVDIIFESNTYVPPFYQGKPQYSHNSVIKFIAIPTVLDQNGRLMKSSEFRYRWYVNNKIVQESQLVGKNYFYFEDDFSNRPIRVSVDVESLNSDFRTLRGVSVSPIDPEIILYEESVVYGPIFERAISSNISTKAREINIRAVPFYFSPDRNIVYNWSMGGNRLENFVNNIVTFRAVNDEPVLSNLAVLISNPAKIGQSAYKYFSLMVNNLND